MQGTEKGTSERTNERKQGERTKRNLIAFRTDERNVPAKRNETQSQIRIIPILERYAKKKRTAFLPSLTYFTFLLVMSTKLCTRAHVPITLHSPKYFSSTFAY